MKARLLAAACVLAASIAVGVSCGSSTTPGSLARLVGSYDLVLIDELGADGAIADVSVDADGNVTTVGIPNRYLVVTSADTNELRVLQLYRKDAAGRFFVRAPNPLETLSIPVIDRPSKLAVDEGRNAVGRRVTGAYVYAARSGGAELSIVGVNTSEATSSFRAARAPLPMPAPVTALAAWMGSALSKLPATTTLYVATFDGTRGGIFRAKLPTNPVDLRATTPTLERLIDTGSESVAALRVVPPLQGRTVDGQAFCDVSECLAIATRKAAGADGRTFLLELSTLRVVPLAFPGPVRELAVASLGTRLYGILDEEKCASTTCGGVLGIDTRTATMPAGFPVQKDFSGSDMAPIRVADSLPMGIALAEGARIRQTAEAADGGTVGLGLYYQTYDLLGVISSSNGELSFFDALAGTMIDYDARRTTISAASLQIPGLLLDGGPGFLSEDGGTLGSVRTGAVSETVPFLSSGATAPYRQVSVQAATDAGADVPFTIEVSDGYFFSQSLVAVYGGLVPGFVKQPTTSADGVHLDFTAGLEDRLEVGDHVVFFTGSDLCGDARIVSIGMATFDVDQVPAACIGRTAYSVRAGAARPVIIAADFEGFMGRKKVGDTLTWNRRYVAFPQGYDGNRTSLTMTIGTLPEIEGAFWSFTIEGRATPYRIAFDSSSIGCSTQVPGRVVLGQLPTLIQNGLEFPWGVMAAAPSANGVVEADLALTFGGVVGLNDGARCYR